MDVRGDTAATQKRDRRAHGDRRRRRERRGELRLFARQWFTMKLCATYTVKDGNLWNRQYKNSLLSISLSSGCHTLSSRAPGRSFSLIYVKRAPQAASSSLSYIFRLAH